MKPGIAANTTQTKTPSFSERESIMFFVAKEKIGTTLGSQKEYTAAMKRGIGFVSHGNVWHYFWPADLMESGIRSRFEPNVAAQQARLVADEDAAFDPHAQQAPQPGAPTHYLWSQEVALGETIGEPVVTPYSGAGDWVEEAKRKFLEVRQTRTH